MTFDGSTFVDELRSATGRPNAALTRELLHEGVGLKVLQRLDLLEHNVRIGNTIFVHGGIDPSLDPVDRPRRAIHDVRREPLAWVQAPFLAWRRGFGGAMVVHGHTPPAEHQVMSGYPDPQRFQIGVAHDRNP